MRRRAWLVLAFVIPPVVIGALTIALRLRGAGAALDAAPVGELVMPDPRPPTTRKRLAVIVAGNRGTEITDALPIVELLEASGAFEVRIVAPRRQLSPFGASTAGAAGLDFVPDLGFDDYGALVGRAPDLLVVPYLPRWEAEDRTVIAWIRDHAGPTTMVLSICRGAELVAAAGLFDGHEATANDRAIATLRGRHPAVRWRTGVRFVRDGLRISSALLAAGLDATLAAIDAVAGRADAARAAVVTGYPRGLRALDDRRQPSSRIPPGLVLDAAYRWRRTQIEVRITDGVAESAVAGVLDAYATTYTTDAIAVASTRRIVRTRYGVALAPRAARATGDVELGAAIPGRYGYDLALAYVARTHGGSMARITAELLDYPAPDLPGGVPVGLAGGLRALALGLIGLGIAAFVTSPRNAARRAASLVQGANS